MKKSGLHKQITSIFDGSLESQSVETASDVRVQAAGTAPTTSRISSAETSESVIEAEPQTCLRPVQTRAIPDKTARPRPVPKEAFSAAVKPSLPKSTQQIKKTVPGGSMTSLRQKKAAILAGFLAVVFAVVLTISLGGIGGGGSAKTNKQHLAEAVSSPSADSKKPTWQIPEPLPETFRDPMQPVREVELEQHSATAALPGDLTVKGIVFSKNKPSALINNEILQEGQIFNGVTIVRIDRTEVEFEFGDQRWTQPVQR